MPNRIHPLNFAILLGALIVAAAPGQVPPPAASQPELAVLLKRLGAESHEERDAAMREIITLGPALAPQLAVQLKVEPDPEVRYRLRYILENITPPDQAVIVLRSAADSPLEPGELITHAQSRRVRSVAELDQARSDARAGVVLRVTGTRGPRDVGPIRLTDEDAFVNYRAPRGDAIVRMIRLFADGHPEQALELLRLMGDDVPADELPSLLRVRIMAVAGDYTHALKLSAAAPGVVQPPSDRNVWVKPAALDLAAPGRGPYRLALDLWAQLPRGIETPEDPDPRVQRVFVRANRILDAFRIDAGLWWNRYRGDLGREERATRIAGNMLAVASWMLAELDLLSECERLIEPRSIILRETSRRSDKWMRVQTDAWLPLLQGDARAALDGFYKDAQGVLANPPDDLAELPYLNPHVAAAIAFFLYQFPEDQRVGEMLVTVNRDNQPALATYAQWMTFAAVEANQALISQHLLDLLPNVADDAAPAVAEAAALMEYVQRQPIVARFDAIRARLNNLTVRTQRSDQALRLVDVLRLIVAGQPAEAQAALAAGRPAAGAAALRTTLEFLLAPPAGREKHAALQNPLLAVPLGRERAAWLVVPRDRRGGGVLRFDPRTGEVAAGLAPSASWFPGPANWPWLGREESSGRGWIYDRRRLHEVATSGASTVALNLRPAEIPLFDEWVGPHFSTLAAALGESAGDRSEKSEDGEYLRADVRAYAEYVANPDLPEIGVLRLIERSPDLAFLAIRGGSQLIIDLRSPSRAWSSTWLAQAAQLARPPQFFPQFAPGADRTARGNSPLLFLFSDQGLLRFDLERQEVTRVPLDGADPHPPVIPEDAPYERRDPRWVYCARPPADGGQVFRVNVADNQVEVLDMLNESLPEDYYRVQTRSTLRAAVSRELAAVNAPALPDFIEQTAAAIARWSETKDK